MPTLKSALVVVLVIGVSGLNFWGYPLTGFHFSDFHYFENSLPAFWGLHILDPQTGRLNYGSLWHNEGLMALKYYLVQQLPLDIETKLVLVNAANIGLHILNAFLFVVVLRRIVGPARVLPFLLVYVLYPFAAANRYWQACDTNQLAAALFLLSLIVFLTLDYSSGHVIRNGARALVSFGFLWLSLITVEWALCLSPLYLYLALYYSNGQTATVRFSRLVTPYSLSAGLFLLASVLPLFLFTGHRLIATSSIYAGRYAELAGQANWDTALVAIATVVVNAMLTGLSFVFANTIGLIVYPVAEIISHGETVAIPMLVQSGIVALAGLTGVAMWTSARSAAADSAFNIRFPLTLGILWTVLAYFPFLLSFGYPRNVGLVADRINVLGSLGVSLCLGSILYALLRLASQCRRWIVASTCALLGVLAGILLWSMQIQKAAYQEAERKERALIEAVFDARTELVKDGLEPVFLLDREEKFKTPRMQLGQALQEPSLIGRTAKIGQFLLGRYFTDDPVPTGLHFHGIYWFWSNAFNFYADLESKPRPIVYRWEYPLVIRRETASHVIGYVPTEVWERAQDAVYRTYPKSSYTLILMRIGQSSFRLGGPLTYQFGPA
jgi:hypothetical protein